MIHKASRFEIKIRNRANTASIVATAAYCAGGRYRCDRTGKVKNYSRRRDVVSVESVRMPDDPEYIFNAACAKEKHPKARLAREFVVSLPRELPLETQRILVRGFCLWMHDCYGLSSMAAIHHPLSDGLDQEIVTDMIPRTEGRKKPTTPRKDERGNPFNQHVHILSPTRFWHEETQSFGKKIRDLEDIVTGPRIIREMRDEWQRRVNRHLQKAGVEACVDLRSYKDMAAAGDAPKGLAAQPKLGPKNAARGRRCELKTGRDDTFLGRAQAETRAKNEALWESWLVLRGLEREKARLEQSQRVAAQNEAVRRAEAEVAECVISTATTVESRIAAMEAAPHLDAVDPMKAAMAWARGDKNAEIEPACDRTIDPETVATPASDRSPKFVMSKNAKQHFRKPRQRQLQRG